MVINPDFTCFAHSHGLPPFLLVLDMLGNPETSMIWSDCLFDFKVISIAYGFSAIFDVPCSVF